MENHNYDRLRAYKANLIPKNTEGAEQPASRAAWLLMKHATKKTIADYKAGRTTLRDALATIADKVDNLDLDHPTASFSMRAKADYTPEMEPWPNSSRLTSADSRWNWWTTPSNSLPPSNRKAARSAGT